MRKLAVFLGVLMMISGFVAGVAGGIYNVIPLHHVMVVWALSCVSLALLVVGAVLCTIPVPDKPIPMRYVRGTMGNSEYRAPPLPEPIVEQRLFEFSAALALNAGFLVVLAQ